jgi:hypothetical protein
MKLISKPRQMMNYREQGITTCDENTRGGTRTSQALAAGFDRDTTSALYFIVVDEIQRSGSCCGRSTCNVLLATISS